MYRVHCFKIGRIFAAIHLILESFGELGYLKNPTILRNLIKVIQSLTSF